MTQGAEDCEDEQAGDEHASVSTEVPVQDQTRTKRIRYKPASKDIK